MDPTKFGNDVNDRPRGFDAYKRPEGDKTPTPGNGLCDPSRWTVTGDDVYIPSRYAKPV